MAVDTIYGIHAVLQVLQTGRRRVDKVLVSTQRQGPDVQRIVSLAATCGIPVETVTRVYLDQLLGHRTHQGVAALVEPLSYQAFASIEAYLAAAQGWQTILVLDGITDVGNFAALIRSAVAFGVDLIVVPRHHSVALTPAVAKRSSGAIEQVAIVQVVNIARALEAFKQAGFWVYGADIRADLPVAQVVWPERLALVLGAEGRGMRRLVREHCDTLIRIPMRSGSDSLNVAVAGAIILAYNWDQRTGSGP